MVVKTVSIKEYLFSSAVRMCAHSSEPYNLPMPTLSWWQKDLQPSYSFEWRPGHNTAGMQTQGAPKKTKQKKHGCQAKKKLEQTKLFLS